MRKTLMVPLFAVAGMFLCGNALALSTHIPHITGGETDWTDYLQVNNNTLSLADFTLTLYNNGNQIYSQTLSVGALSRSQIQLKALNPNAETGIITYTEPGLVFRVSYNSSAGGIAEFRTIDTLGSNVGFYFSDFTDFVQWKGAAIANMGTTPAQLTLYALGGSSQGGGGAILSTKTETINPMDKIVGIHSAWFSRVSLGQIESIVAVTSSSSLCGIAIGGDMALSRLLFTPATPLSSFNPQPGTDYSIYSGTWNLTPTITGSSPETTCNAEPQTQQITVPPTGVFTYSSDNVCGTVNNGIFVGNALTYTTNNLLWSHGGIICCTATSACTITFSDYNYGTGSCRSDDCPGQRGDWCTWNVTVIRNQ
ncbi:MAG: hypothetical protein ACYC7J_14090 [Syntrophales bacterium]